MTEIRDFRPALRGLILTLSCPNCKQSFEAVQPTYLGVVFGEHTCPSCDRTLSIQPNDLIASFIQFVPDLEPEEAKTLSSDAALVANRWHQDDLLIGLLNYRGVNLGEVCESELLNQIVFGLYVDLVEKRMSPRI